MLKVEHISSGYGIKQVLFDISFEVKRRELVLITGGNGSGKSTLLKCIYNLLPCWSGEIFFEGEKINDLRPYDLIKRGVVCIPQKDFCFENLTVAENLKISGNIYTNKDLMLRIDKVYEQTGLGKFKKRKPFKLSGGEKKLLAFGMGLIHQPKLILFDEPLSGVDKKNSQQLVAIIQDSFINNSIGIIIVEHKDLHNKLFTKRIKMELGKIN